MKRIYEENGICAKGNILPLSLFRPFLDLDEITPDEKYLDELVKIAEGMLDEEIPLLPLSLYRTIIIFFVLFAIIYLLILLFHFVSIMQSYLHLFL